MDILRRIIVNLLHRHQMLKLKYGRTEQLEDMLDTVEKVESPDDKLLKRLMKTVNHYLDNADLSVDMLASEVGLSRVHLNRKMKELTGQTPHDFIRSIRLKQAAKQLAAGGRTVSDVTYSCGFSNAASFSTLFKKTFGVSPRDYMIGKGGEK
jgi:AraC-like DNA-binding protein